MAQTAILRTARLTLEPLSERHVTERYVAWLNDPVLMRFSEQRHRQHTIESCRAYRDSFAGTPNHLWAIEETDQGLGHIGNINAYVDVPNSLADVGILIGAAAARGGGFGLEAWLAVLDHLMNTQGLRKVAAGCIAENTAMLRIMEGSGMVEDGRRRCHYLVDGRDVDIVHAAAFRSTWTPVGKHP
ncbi:GNAT family N-acetyltransferase [Rhodospira trueperi]|uniref:Protein N-acetyltransferase, RimJ/RimL family n=1 Tax=Rhodospira trueperi TaxID=69960 RepID=A0A1G6ZDR0_9PROT|nr:GNAT family N-acetyltransferase [Rhodospira trueperi]SDE00327.1 Protein N-acetyltransferase, RimJ/RimL family [Rhodospira trueperi]